MYLTGPIIRKLYNIRKTRDNIEIWQTHSFNNQNTVDNILFPNENYWDSSSEIAEPAFVIHFKNLLVHSNKFSFIVAKNSYLDNYTINSWKVYGSMDNTTWININEVADYQELQPNIEKEFDLKDTVFSWYKFTFQKTTYNSVVVYLKQLEIYGNTFPNSFMTRIYNNYYLFSFLCYIFILFH